MSANSLRLPNPTALTSTRAQRLFDDLQRRFQNQELLSHDDVRGAVYEALQEFFLHAAEPVFKGAELLKNQPRLRRTYLEPLRKIADDLAVAYREGQALTNATTASFNFQTALLESLFGRLKRAGSTLIDLQIAQDRFNQAVIVAGDDFTDDSRIDTNAALSLPKADVQPLGNILTLHRTGNQSVVDLQNVKVRVEPGQDYRFRLYEGQFYGLAGQAVPEGGSFHWFSAKTGTSPRRSLPNDLLRRFHNYFDRGTSKASSKVDVTSEITNAVVQSRSGGAFAGFSETEWELLAGTIQTGSELATLIGGEVREFANALDPALALIDNGASPEERLVARLAMLDGNPDSFWQVEYTRQIPEEARPDLSNQSPFTPLFSLLDAIDARLQDAENDQAARAFDVLDLDIVITVDLGSIQTANWVDLVPMLFDGIEHLQVLSIESSADGQIFNELPRLREGEGGNRVGRDSNKTLDADTVNAVLAPSASVFTGRGLWVFAPRPMQFLRLTLRQPVPVVVPYHRLSMTLERTVRRRHSRGTFGRRRPSTQTTETRTVLLSYPETVQVLGGSADPASVAGAQGAVRLDPESALQNLLEGGGISVSNLNQSIRDLASQLGGKNSRGRTLIGNEDIVDQSLTIMNDQQRYAIGIRDLGIWQYRFTESSELVSVPFKSPEAIRDISLEVDEVIPKEFTEGQEITSFIEYFVGLGESQEWIPIAPVTDRVIRTLEGNALPTVIHVNSGIPPAERNPAEAYVDFDNEVTEARLRIILRRPTDLANAESFTPALKSYRLTWTVRGGFR
jgi:hypothetical protein